VLVPDRAQVWFDKKETPTTGTSRVFTSAAIQPDQSVNLTVQARWDGSTRTMVLPLRAGDKMSIDLR
jgi:uncharacterized protein (TIGR03000 family)